MEKVVRKFKSHAEQEAADREFYRSLTPQERVDLMLRIIHEANRDAPPRLERVCRIIKREPR